MIDLKIIYIIIVTILFSLAIAISLRQYTMEKSKSIMIAIYLNLILLISIFIANIFSESISPLINNNISFIMTVIGMLLIYTGYRFIFEFKNKVKYNNTHQITLKIKIQKNFALMLLFISYFLSILINVIYVAPIMWTSIFQFGLVIVGSSFIISLISILILYKMIKTPKILYNGIFGFFASLSGVLYFVLYMFIPNLQDILTEKMTPLAFPAANLIIYIIILGIISMLCGFFIKKSKKLKNLI